MSEPPPDTSQPPTPPSPGSWWTRYVGLPVVGWTPITILFGVLTAIGITIVGTIPVGIADPDLDSTAAADLAQLMVAAGMAGGALVFALSDTGGKLAEALRKLGFRGITIRVVGLAIVAWLAYLVLAAIAAPLLQPEQEDITREIGGGDDSVIGLVAAGILIVVAAPIAEEIFFRGFMFAGLRNAVSIWPAALISALVWGSLHLTAGNIGVAIQISILGLVLAWLYERSGTLWAPIVAHGINNTIAFIVLVTDAV